jgi:predicted deacylase
MSSRYREPRLEDMLADSIVKAVMEADGVDPRQLEAELRQTTALLRAYGALRNRRKRSRSRVAPIGPTNRAHTTRHDATHRFH